MNICVILEKCKHFKLWEIFHANINQDLDDQKITEKVKINNLKKYRQWVLNVFDRNAFKRSGNFYIKIFNVRCYICHQHDAAVISLVSTMAAAEFVTQLEPQQLHNPPLDL